MIPAPLLIGDTLLNYAPAVAWITTNAAGWCCGHSAEARQLPSMW